MDYTITIEPRVEAHRSTNEIRDTNEYSAYCFVEISFRDERGPTPRDKKMAFTYDPFWKSFKQCQGWSISTTVLRAVFDYLDEMNGELMHQLAVMRSQYESVEAFKAAWLKNAAYEYHVAIEEQS